MTALDDLSALRENQLAAAVVKFEELLAQCGRAFLIGAGCSKCAGLPLTSELTTQVLQSKLIDAKTKAILTAIRDLFNGATDTNIEDYLSELIDLLAIVDRRASRGAALKSITLGVTSYNIEELRTAVDQVKQGIAEIFRKEVNIDTHREFVRVLHKPLRPGKSAAGQMVNYLVLNYDTMLEDALALERISFSDGLDGGATGWWCPQTFERDGLSANVFKLHGSIDWCEFAEDPLPRRMGKRLPNALASERILIWPASTKYRETQLDPFAQLLEHARKALRPCRDSQCVLVICGYRFKDTHINYEIDRALREPSRDLTVVAFTSENQPMGQLAVWHQDAAVTDQVLIYANRGFFHGNRKVNTGKDLLWWKFENVTRLLGGER